MSPTPTHFHSPALEFTTGRQARETEGRSSAGWNGGTLLPAFKTLRTQKAAGGTTAPTSHY